MHAQWKPEILLGDARPTAWARDYCKIEVLEGNVVNLVVTCKCVAPSVSKLKRLVVV